MPKNHDSYARSELSRLEIAADLIRLTFPNEIAQQLYFESMPLTDGRLGDDRLRSDIETDFLFELSTHNGDPTLVYLLLEHQSTVDRWMALRMLRYRVRVWEAYRRRTPRSPLLPVLYHGTRPWNAPQDVAELANPLDRETAISASPSSRSLQTPDSNGSHYRISLKESGAAWDPPRDHRSLHLLSWVC